MLRTVGLGVVFKISSTQKYYEFLTRHNISNMYFFQSPVLSLYLISIILVFSLTIMYLFICSYFKSIMNIILKKRENTYIFKSSLNLILL